MKTGILSAKRRVAIYLIKAAYSTDIFFWDLVGIGYHWGTYQRLILKQLFLGGIVNLHLFTHHISGL